MRSFQLNQLFSFHFRSNPSWFRFLNRGLYLYVDSPIFNERLRTFIVQKIAAYTGTKVSLGSMHWSLREQRVVLDDMILRGNEPALLHPSWFGSNP